MLWAQAGEHVAEVDIAPPAKLGRCPPLSFPGQYAYGIGLGVRPGAPDQGQGGEMVNPGRAIISGIRSVGPSLAFTFVLWDSGADAIHPWTVLWWLGNPVFGNHRAFLSNPSG